MSVPFLDLKTQYAQIKSEIDAAWSQIFEKCDFILGRAVEDFEKEFADYCGTKYCVGVADGTEALQLSIRALDFSSQDEVILPANTFIATALGAHFGGIKIKLCDVSENDFLLDLNRAESLCSSNTKLLIPVHLYGRLNSMDDILSLCHSKNLKLIEDSAQSHGAKSNAGRKAGSFGDLACFSFYPGKNLGAYGDGGAITTSSQVLRDKLIALRNYGSPVKYHHPVAGFNSRLDSMQAAVLRVKLKRLDGWNQNRKIVAKKYGELLEGVGDLVLPQIPKDESHVFHLFVVRTKKRDALMAHLQKHGIGSVIHYPVPIHLQGAFSHLGHKNGDFPVAERISREIFSLPMFPEMTDAQILEVSDTVKAFFKK